MRILYFFKYRGSVVKLTVSMWLACAAWLWTGAASAQTADQEVFSGCPVFPAEISELLRWEAMRVPDMLLCRAIRTDDASEAFALTLSRESPFKPRRSDRAEVGNLNGREVQWYRGEVPNEPQVMIRETLMEIGKNQVIHVFMRAKDAEMLARHQQYVLSLPIPPPVDD